MPTSPPPTDGTLKDLSDRQVAPTSVRTGASIGAYSTIVCGVEIGAWSMIGAGSVVTRDVPPHALVRGNPARVVGVVGRSGKILSKRYEPGNFGAGDDSLTILAGWVEGGNTKAEDR